MYQNLFRISILAPDTGCDNGCHLLGNLLDGGNSNKRRFLHVSRQTSKDAHRGAAEGYSEASK